MTTKILIAAALSLGLGTGFALAQNDQLEPDNGAAPCTETTVPTGPGSIGETFFVDPATGTLRSEAEVRAGWEGLTMTEQAEIRSYCNAVDMAAAPDDQMTTGSITPDEPTAVASIEQSCSWIGGM
jgi:hypothetical protein